MATYLQDGIKERILPAEIWEQVIMEVAERFLIPRFRSLGMNASGEWIDSLHAQGNVLRGRHYTEYLEYGRRPNQNQDPMALRAWAVYYGNTVIKDWVEAKGLDLDPIAVAYNIAKNGTTWLEKGGSDLMEVLKEPEVKEFMVARLRNGIKFSLRLYVSQEIRSKFKKQ